MLCREVEARLLAVLIICGKRPSQRCGRKRICRIPDDYISVSRLPLFSAREVLRGLVEDLKTCCPGELPA